MIGKRGRSRSIIKERLPMNRILSCAAVLGLLIASSSSVFAGGHGGSSASTFTPAYLSKTGSTNPAPVPNLSGPAAYAPGQQMRFHNGSTTPSTGASVYAPGFLK
jgi:hypothetical protein